MVRGRIRTILINLEQPKFVYSSSNFNFCYYSRKLSSFCTKAASIRDNGPHLIQETHALVKFNNSVQRFAITMKVINHDPLDNLQLHTVDWAGRRILSSKFCFWQNTTVIQEQKTLCKYKNAHDIAKLLHFAGGHHMHGSRKVHQASNQIFFGSMAFNAFRNWILNIKLLKMFLKVKLAISRH